MAFILQFLAQTPQDWAIASAVIALTGIWVAVEWDVLAHPFRRPPPPAE